MDANTERNTSRDTSGSKQPMLTVRLSGKTHHLNIECAFSLAHQLVSRGHFAAAMSVLEWLEESLSNDRRVMVLHARCEARQGHYAECSQLLSKAFSNAGQYGDVPGPLHTAIVYRATGLFPDARGELTELCSKHPELASLWLFAGDMWLAAGRPDKAQQAWRAAAQHEEQEPPLISTTVRHRIKELAEKP